jgi:hypothetical protein
MFIRMLHEQIMEYRNVYLNNVLHEEIMEYGNVYVNVTWRDNGISKYLCEYYMKR